MQSTRIGFPDAIRGIAALSVIAGHYFATFFEYQPSIAALLGVPALTEIVHPAWPFSMVGSMGTVLGQFGVGVFFIISGFVIPFSLSVGRRRFIIQRVFRVFPVYIVGFLTVVAFIGLLNVYMGLPFPYSITHILAHLGVLSRGLLGFDRIDGISWTLEVELVFYIVMALFGHRIIGRHNSVYFVAVTALGIAAIGCMVLAPFGYVSLTPGMQLWSSQLLILGLVYYSLYTAKLGNSLFLILHAFIALMLVLVWFSADKSAFNYQWIVGYGLAMAIFGFCYRWRDSIHPGRILLHFSAISYPLYVVHALSGYAMMYFLIKNGISTLVALGTTFGTVYLIANVIHRVVETPAIKFSKLNKAYFR